MRKYQSDMEEYKRDKSEYDNFKSTGSNNGNEDDYVNNLLNSATRKSDKHSKEEPKENDVQEIDYSGMSKNQLKGYISQLQTKGLVSIDESSFHNITMSIKGCNYLLDNTDTDHEVIHEIKSNAAIFD